MRVTKVFAVAVALALPAASVGCTSASDAEVVQEGGKARIRWNGSGARLCVTAPEASCPADKDGRVSGGRAFWVIDATCFNAGSGFSSPVTYGEVPECAKDVTADHGGKPGGEPLEKGKKYKVSVSGFGGDPTTAEMMWK